jgi:uncharacterized protein
MLIWSAFLIGMAGSLHCVGMCGPIAMALPQQGAYRWAMVGKLLLYHLGRITTYAGLGMLIGFLGQGLVLAGLQMYVSVLLGVLLLVVALLSINVETMIHRWAPVRQFQQWVRRSMGQLLNARSNSALLGLGMLNGLLPCGLVYMAVVGAVATGNVFQGAAYMALFGAGTIPLMLLTSVAGQFIDVRWRNQLRRLTPIFLIAFALLFISRGLQFELPTDIRFWEAAQDVPMCH